MPHYRVTPTGLMIPVVDSSKGEPRFKCTTIVSSRDGEDVLCGTPFWALDDLIAHAVTCSRQHEAEIREAAPSQRLGALGPQNQTDWEDWLDQQDAGGESNRRKVIRGAKKF